MIDLAALRALIVECVREAIRQERVIATADALLTTTEAATEARVDVGTIRGWVNAGHLTRHTTGPGGHLRISRAELREYLASEKARKTGAGVTPQEAARRALARKPRLVR